MPQVKVTKQVENGVLRGFLYETTFPDGTPFQGWVPYESGDTVGDIRAKVRLHFNVAKRLRQGPADDPNLPAEDNFNL